MTMILLKNFLNGQAQLEETLDFVEEKSILTSPIVSLFTDY